MAALCTTRLCARRSSGKSEPEANRRVDAVTRGGTTMRLGHFHAADLPAAILRGVAAFWRSGCFSKPPWVSVTE